MMLLTIGARRLLEVACTTLLRESITMTDEKIGTVTVVRSIEKYNALAREQFNASIRGIEAKRVSIMTKASAECEPKPPEIDG